MTATMFIDQHHPVRKVLQYAPLGVERSTKRSL
jgi:hypothetical protein